VIVKIIKIIFFLIPYRTLISPRAIICLINIHVFHVTLASFRVFVSYTIQIAGLEDMIHRLSANIGNTAGSPANSDNATSPDKDIPSRSVQSTQVRDTTFGSVSSPTRSTSSNISMPTVSPPVLNRTTTKYASDYYENTNPPPARAYSSARGSTGHSPSDSDDGVLCPPRR